MMTDPVLRFEQLTVTYHPQEGGRAGSVHALRGLSLRTQRGSRVGIVGESGSGKTTVGLALLRLLPRSAACAGIVEVRPRNGCCGDVVNVYGLSNASLRHFRGNHVSMVFQDPFNALNPVLRVGQQVVSAIRYHRSVGMVAATAYAEQLLRRVHLDEPATVMRKYPHQLSGGQLQRVCIAIAAAHDPDVIVADEPTTALDAHLREGILTLLDEAAATGSCVLLITHDIAVVSAHTDRICILYAGELVESGPTQAVITQPLHPYTRLLIAARPTAQRRGLPLPVIPGALPDLRDTGLFARCIFWPRCPERLPMCERSCPPPAFRRDDREVRCYRYGGSVDD